MKDKLKILMTFPYFDPYCSGITEYIKRLGSELVKRGHIVTVVTSMHEPLPEIERIQGIKVIRVPVLAKFSRGLIMPKYLSTIKKLIPHFDVVHVHPPMLEAGPIALLSDKTVLTYHCDLILNNAKLTEKFYYWLTNIAFKKSRRLVSYTQDYTPHSPLLKKFKKRIRYVYPPIDESHFKYTKENFKKEYKIKGKVIGYAGRFVYEKGLPFILKSIPLVLKKYPDAKFILAGPQEVAGGSNMKGLKKLLEKYKDQVILPGLVSYEDLPQFYSACDVLLLPSIQKLESFGIVQIEAMLCKTPCIVTDLPGVRVPIQKTGMGLIVPRRDSAALGNAIIKVLGDKKFIKSRNSIVKEFGLKKTVDFYENLYYELK